MAPLPAIRWPITPNGGFDRLATPGSDPEEPFELCGSMASMQRKQSMTYRDVEMWPRQRSSQEAVLWGGFLSPLQSLKNRLCDTKNFAALRLFVPKTCD